MGQIEWSIWANEQAIASAIMLLLGGIVGTVAQIFTNWGYGIYSLLAGTFVLVFEYPRGSRSVGSTKERRFQRFLVPLHSKCGIVASNYFVRFVLYLIIPTPCCFLLPTLMGGMCLYTASLIYFIAALRGESWKLPVAEPQPS